jgi:hypothetical protein
MPPTLARVLPRKSLDSSALASQAVQVRVVELLGMGGVRSAAPRAPEGRLEASEVMGMCTRVGRMMEKTGSEAVKLREVGKRKDSIWNEFVVNIGYLPLTVHWYGHHGRQLTRSEFRSLEKGLLQERTTGNVPWADGWYCVVQRGVDSHAHT